MRNILNINKDWKFTKDNIAEAKNTVFNDNNWEPIDLPHTWNAEDGTTGDNNYFRGACWYRKNLQVSSLHKGKKIFIEFQGVNSIANVYLNDIHLGEHRGGYSTFRFDVTDIINFDSINILAVQADNTAVPDVYPLWADFTFYGGIYRDVNLIITEDIHFDLMDHGSTGVYISQDHITDELAQISVKANISSDSPTDENISVWAHVIDQEGNVVKYNGTPLLMTSSTTNQVTLPINIENPILWEATAHPYLYNIHITLMRKNDVIDELTIPTGLRYFSFDAKEGFFLNGKSMRLNGVSRHQDKLGKGWALSKDDHRFDMELIKEVGANSIRLAHYQHDSYFYDLCDQNGMLIWAEIPLISVASKTDFEGLNAKSQMVELIRQNYNHSSIIMWGVQNEIQIGGDQEYVRQIVQDLNTLAKSEDSTRLTTQAQVMMVPNDDPYHHYTDIMAYNKYYGWYNGEATDFAGWLDDFHATNPDVCLGISEYGAEGILTYHSDAPVVKDYTEEYHALYHETVMDIFNSRNFIWGTYVWNFFDFGSDFRNEGGVKGRNNKGLVTFDRKIKKDAFYLYKALWSDETFIHITSKRFIERATETINIKVYSNCDEVTLYINNTEVATLTGTHTFTFNNITLQPGSNDIKAVGKKGNLTVQDYALFIKTEVAHSLYNCPEEKGGVVTNWFEDNKARYDVEVEELTIPDDVYSSKCKIKELMDHPSTRLIIEDHFSEALNKPTFGMMEMMTIDQLSELASDVVTKQVVYVINKELMQIKKA